MKFLQSLVPIPFLSLPTLIHAACNPESCAGALGGAIVPSVPAAVAAEGATIGGCVAATLISIIIPALAPVSMVCWGLAAIEPAVTAGGPIALAGLAGGCFDCTAAKPCDQNDAVARSHGCGGVSLLLLSHLYHQLSLKVKNRIKIHFNAEANMRILTRTAAMPQN